MSEADSDWPPRCSADRVRGGVNVMCEAFDKTERWAPPHHIRVVLSELNMLRQPGGGYFHVPPVPSIGHRGQSREGWLAPCGATCMRESVKDFGATMQRESRLLVPFRAASPSLPALSESRRLAIVTRAASESSSLTDAMSPATITKELERGQPGGL